MVTCCPRPSLGLGKTRVTRLRPKLGILLVLLCGTLSIIPSGCGDDRIASSYVSLAAAEKDGAIERGWLADYLPKSARNIQEMHDLSPSTGWSTFEFSPDGSWAFRKRLSHSRWQRRPLGPVPNPHVPWWPAPLSGMLGPEEMSRLGFELYTVSELDGHSIRLFAVDWHKGRAYSYTAAHLGEQ
jgi:hypothetical protein